MNQSKNIPSGFHSIAELHYFCPLPPLPLRGKTSRRTRSERALNAGQDLVSRQVELLAAVLFFFFLP